MLVTDRRRLRMIAGIAESANLLMVRLLVADRSQGRTYSGRAFRTYMALGGRGAWRSRDIFDLLPELRQHPTRITLEHLPGEGINDPIDELAYLALVTAAIQPRCVFEIGTFRGRTALNFAINSPAGCEVHTLDLPEDPGAASQHLVSADRKLVAARRVGADYHGKPEATKITQHIGDSRTFDFSSFVGKADIVFVDGGHTYELARNDSLRAIEVCRPGGIVLWHDFANYGDYHDVTRAILDVLPHDCVYQIADTQLAFYRLPPA